MRCMEFSGAKRTRTSSARVSARSATGSRGGAAGKKQPPDSSTPHPPTLPIPTPPLTRHQHQLQIQQQQQQQQLERGVVNSKPHPSTAHSNSSSSDSILNSIGPKPSQSESRMPGRHPHPPTGNNTKLKHKCPFDGCPWRFATPYKLRRHIKSHTKETPFLCKECGRGFSVRYNLLMHIQTIHSQPQRFKCPMKGCKEAFHTQPRLNGHMRRIHKRDWKTIQTPKTEGEGKQGGGGGGSRSSSTSSDDSVEAAPKTQRFECLQCSSVFPSQAKLNAHLKSHASDKAYKCTVQGCNKTFPTKDKLTKHLEIHKQPKQFSCPHENCNRVFLRQSHLKNHLKIHTQDYFVCPVMDCNEKFASESDYNIHLNTHMNYRHKCQVAGCGHAFLTRKRLELHCRVMHGLELHGHQPLLSGHIGHAPPPLIPHSQHSPPHPHILTTCPLTHANLVDVEEGIREVDLPGLSADEIETILSENSNWSGEKFKNFFHSAVELSEMEAKLFSGSGYESDSGYSTYDVSPITSSAPMQFGACRPAVSTSYRSISPALTPVNPSPYISLSSSNPFQFGHTSMHMSLHSSGPPTTPLPHSASPDADFAFFPPTPSYHPPLSGPAVLTPTQEPYMLQQAGPHSNGYPIQVSAQYQRDFQLPPYAPVLAHSQQPHQPQPQEYSIEFPDVLADAPATKDCMQRQCGGIQRRQRVSSLTLLPQDPNEIKIKVERKPCPNASCVTSSSPVALTFSTALPLPALVKVEPVSNESPCNNGTSAGRVSQPPSTPTTHETSHRSSPSSRDSASSSSQLQSFLDACSKIPSLQELISSSANNSSVIVATVSIALAALVEDHTKGGETREVKVQQSLHDIPQLLSRIARLTPQQLEKLADRKLISAAKLVATKNCDSLVVAAPKTESGKQTSSRAGAISGISPLNSTSEKATSSHLTGSTIAAQSKTPTKTSIVVKAISKTQPLQQQKQKSGGTVSRVGASSHMKHSLKKKTQWPRSMSKANLMAFREHILNKLKRGREEGQGSNSSSSSSPTHTSSVVSTPFKVEMGCDGDIPIPLRCSSEPADFFSHQTHTDSLGGGGPLQTSHSAGDLHSRSTLKHIHCDTDAHPPDYNQDNMHPDFNPDVLFSSSVLSLPDTLMPDMEIDSLGSISSPSEHDLVQFLCDPSPPSSVRSPIDNMEDLNSIQDFLSGSSETSLSPTHFNQASSPTAPSMHNNSFPSTPTSTDTTTATVQPSTFTATGQAGENAATVCSMADVASLFNESINSIANIESVPEPTTVVLEDSLESVFQRTTDPLLTCGSRLHW